MPCCQGQNYDTLFDRKTAHRQLKKYRRRGATGATARLLKLISLELPSVESSLDIGGGVGVLQHELAEQGGHVFCVDASRAYLDVAREEAEHRGYAQRWQGYLGDFVELQEQVVQADVVTLDKVICCYPKVEDLVVASASKARKLYGIVVPKDAWWTRFGLALGNLVIRVLRWQFQSFVHPHGEIDAHAASQGFTLAREHRGLFWAVRLYKRSDEQP
jgi:magnesium-protoporphyrin O-methyltransferase